MVVSFLPVFLLEAQERPPVPALGVDEDPGGDGRVHLGPSRWCRADGIFIRGGSGPNRRSGLTCDARALSPRVAFGVCDTRRTPVALQSLFLGRVRPAGAALGSQFMRRSSRARPSTCPRLCPGFSITQAAQLSRRRTEMLRSFPEVESVLRIGRPVRLGDGNAPLDMFDTDGEC